VTTSNYNSFTNSHNFQFTLASSKSSASSLGVTTQLLPTMSASPPPPWGGCLTELGLVWLLSERTQQKTPLAAVHLFLSSCICCGGHMIWLSWESVYTAIAWQRPIYLVLIFRPSGDMSQYFLNNIQTYNSIFCALATFMSPRRMTAIVLTM
jgi:hypothetical protein